MGELIKKVKRLNFQYSFLDIELNKPSGDINDLEVHLQNDFIRYSLNQKKFLKFAAAVLEAERQFKYLKGIKNE